MRTETHIQPESDVFGIFWTVDPDRPTEECITAIVLRRKGLREATDRGSTAEHVLDSAVNQVQQFIEREPASTD